MKRFVLLFLFVIAAVPAARAQSEEDHLQAGVFADYFRLSQTDVNFAGLGGRFTVTAYQRLKLEAEMGYDFNQIFTEGFTNTTTGSVTLARSNVRLLHGLFGPKLEIGHHAIRPFVTIKGGFFDSMFDVRPATFDTFSSSVQNLRAKNLSGVLYPGGGLEGRLGPIGLRLDVGDEMYFNRGTHHNVRVAFGPFIHF